MRRRILLLLFVVTLGLAAAKAELAAATDTVYFGFIREADGPKTLRTYVVNTGPDSVSLLKVRPSCGCTAASFQQDPVAPGDSAWIELTYNPYRRPGSFEKSVKVYPSEGEMIRLPISGTVIASPETIGGMFPSDGGLLHLSESTLMTLRPLSTGEKTLYTDYYNSGSQPVYMRLECNSEAVTAEAFPPSAAPGDKGMIGFYINPSRESREGKIEYTILLYTALSPDFSDAEAPVEIKIFTEK